jgi:hypothetical protein
MRAFKLTVDPFIFTEILDVSIKRGVNCHGSARVKGIIDEDMEGKYIEMSLSDTPVTIFAEDFDGQRRDLFQGVLEDMEIKVENGLNTMELSIMPRSRLLDIKPVNRVFQDESLSYNDMVEFILSSFDDAAAIINASDGQPLGRMFVQYQETEWAFLKRMASTRHDVLIANDTLKGIRLYFGFPNISANDAPPLSPISFKVYKDIGGYLRSRENNVSLYGESDSLYYVVKDREIRGLGEPVTFQRRPLFVTAIESIWEGRELVHNYTLMTKGGTRVPESKNFNIIGASLSGTVNQVSGSKVKMSLPEAHSNDPSKTKWYAFSTVYSSPDGSGWYAMPVIGDALRLYFPTETESDGYAISAVHLKVNKSVAESPTADKQADNGERSQPDNMYIYNNFGKMIALTPTTIQIVSGGKSITIDDNAGITITSDADITITGSNNVTLQSLKGSIVMAGEETVTLEQKDAVVELNEENVVFKGGQVKTE